MSPPSISKTFPIKWGRTWNTTLIQKAPQQDWPNFNNWLWMWCQNLWVSAKCVAMKAICKRRSCQNILSPIINRGINLIYYKLSLWTKKQLYTILHSSTPTNSLFVGGKLNVKRIRYTLLYRRNWKSTKRSRKLRNMKIM